MEEPLNRTQYRIVLFCLKYIPFLIAILKFLNIILCLFFNEFAIISAFIYISILPGILILLFSKLFRFCIWHRLPIYYCWTNDIISWYDYLFTISVSIQWLFFIYLVIALIFIILGMYFKNKYNAKTRSN